jgi:3-phosphoshikimate 1-carboxyvinyltransferase
MNQANGSDAVLIAPWPTRTRGLSACSISAPFSPDKSLTHRAMMLAAMAEGQSVIRHPLEGEDCIATREAFSSLGVDITISDDHGVRCWTVASPGIDGWRQSKTVTHLDLGNSGTSARLLMGLFAGVPGLTVTLTGDDSLRKRPMGRVAEPLRSMGAEISGETGGDHLPLTITGRRLYGRSLTAHVASAQVKSSVLLAAASASGQTMISLPFGARDHTERMLQSLGAQITVSRRFDRESISMVGPWRPKPFHYDVPGDPSSAAFFAALAALHEGVTVHASRLLLNPTRIGFFKILERMGCQVNWTPTLGLEQLSAPLGEVMGEAVGDVTIARRKGQRLMGVHLHGRDIATFIDEVPILAVVCSAAEGETRIDGLAELRVKESDRLARILTLLHGAGITARADGDSLWIQGGQRPVGFEFKSQDHRMVMSACILATTGTAPSRIFGASWIQTSFPLFLPALQNINVGLDNI